jgi:hypothetical protein
MAGGHHQGEAATGDGDDRLVDELRRITEIVDPVPTRVLEAARGSFTWRTIDADLAELAYDSAIDPEAAALVRNSTPRRLLSFESPELSVEMEVTSVASERRLVGQLVPAQTAAIEIRHPGGALAVAADELGRFAADGVAPGPVSVVCRMGEGPGSRTIATDWLVL